MRKCMCVKEKNKIKCVCVCMWQQTFPFIVHQTTRACLGTAHALALWEAWAQLWDEYLLGWDLAVPANNATSINFPLVIE